MMWTTQDGYRLELPEHSLRATVSQVGTPEGLPLAPGAGSCGSCTAARVAEHIAQAVASARRVGTLRHRQTGEGFPLFVGRVGDQEFEIITELGGAGEFEGNETS